MTKYKIIIDRKDCILCGNCYSLDPKHFEPDNEYRSMIVNGETTEDISLGTFDDDGISLAKQAVEECPVEIISVKEL
ncbi:MAG: ferredoxin [Candidatus Heimdallarchaeota archaeon]|jgi:ferredoxin|nr:ferredoxin [Candidatus Heimdallarchaeota archaeon]MBY8995042.1 ferredoxin [Candidatus Heimdallarchaeota archaeon]